VVSALEARITPSRPRWARHPSHQLRGGDVLLLLHLYGHKAPVSHLITRKEISHVTSNVEPSSRLLHPSSLALDALRRFQLTPLRTAVAVVLVLVVLAFITVASTALAFTVVAFTVVQPYAVGWP
jgi:hypothetical protein